MIRVGGATEVEVKERKDRVDDALHATRAAVEEGIVPGGGVALLMPAKVLAKLRPTTRTRSVGIEIVRRALHTRSARSPRMPAQDGAVVVGKLLEKDDRQLRLRRADRRV